MQPIRVPQLPVLPGVSSARAFYENTLFPGTRWMGFPCPGVMDDAFWESDAVVVITLSRLLLLLTASDTA